MWSCNAKKPKLKPNGQYARGLKDTILRWSTTLKANEKEKLLAEGSLKMGVHFTLKEKRGTSLWPAGQAGIVVKAESSKGKLKVSYFQEVDRVMNTRPIKTQRMGVIRYFECDLGNHQPSKTWLLYKGGREQTGEYKYPKIPKRLFEIDVSLPTSCVPVSREKPIECNLKVTDGSDLKN